MDTSETYVKMCEKAKEIQKIRPPTSGSAYHEYFADGTTFDILHEDNGYYFGPGNGVTVWLPRQDQLQDMAGVFPEVFERFGNTVGQNDFNYGLEEMGEYTLWETYSRFTSMEQLWLAFVMQEKYGKYWNGEDLWHE